MRQNPPCPDQLNTDRLDTAQTLADFLRLSKAAIRKYSRDPNFPKIKINRAVRFDRQSVLAYLQSRNEGGQ